MDLDKLFFRLHVGRGMVGPTIWGLHKLIHFRVRLNELELCTSGSAFRVVINFVQVRSYNVEPTYLY